jgi:nucleoside-diphosphate-sugar epimerase
MIAAATYRMRLQPSHPSWLDLALKLPIMDTDRARRELGWEAQYSALDALMEVFEGLHDRAGMRSPPLAAEALQRA